MHILVTGGAGFIGSAMVRHLLASAGSHRVTVLDKLTYAGNLENLAEVAADPRFTFVRGDIADAGIVRTVLASGVDAIMNFAAESHVDRSILEARAFVETNVVGTQVLLDAAREASVARFVQVSTDEVYGSLGKTGTFTEESPLSPNSPYAASKAAADHLALAAHRTYGLPVIVTRGSNTYGSYQFPEKFIPLFVTNALDDRPLPLYGDGLQVRDWLHVTDHCLALEKVLHDGKPGNVYNVGGGEESANIAVAKQILAELGKPDSLIVHVADRLGHDRRYALDIAKIQEDLGWKPRVSFEVGLRDTIAWYRAHPGWWERIKTGAYLDYYETLYGERLRCASR